MQGIKRSWAGPSCRCNASISCSDALASLYNSKDLLTSQGERQRPLLFSLSTHTSQGAGAVAAGLVKGSKQQCAIGDDQQRQGSGSSKMERAAPSIDGQDELC